VEPTINWYPSMLVVPGTVAVSEIPAGDPFIAAMLIIT
jgi:hypothetical protein